MMGIDLFGILSSLLQPGLAFYALRLNRLFGTQRVGWLVFYTFAALAALHLVHLVHSGGVVVGVMNVAISVLLLLGLAQAEAFCSGRMKVERREQQLQAELDKLSSQTTELEAANAKLVQQMVKRDQDGRALRYSEQQFRLVFEQNPQPMWIFDLRSWRLLAINHAALRQSGFDREELMASTAKDFYAAEDVAAFQHECLTPSAPGESGKLWRLRCKDGSRLHVEVRKLDLFYNDCPARLMVTSEPARPIA